MSLWVRRIFWRWRRSEDGSRCARDGGSAVVGVNGVGVNVGLVVVGEWVDRLPVVGDGVLWMLFLICGIWLLMGRSGW